MKINQCNRKTENIYFILTQHFCWPRWVSVMRVSQHIQNTLTCHTASGTAIPCEHPLTPACGSCTAAASCCLPGWWQMIEFFLWSGSWRDGEVGWGEMVPQSSLASSSNTYCDSPKLKFTDSYWGRNCLALGASYSLYSGVLAAIEWQIQTEDVWLIHLFFSCVQIGWGYSSLSRG